MSPAELRRMLELAAKATGQPGVFQQWSDSRDSVSCGIAPNGSPGRMWWNPADDDGISRRLEVRLMLEVYHAENDGQMVCAVGYAGPLGKILYVMEPHGSDPEAATRLAVLRAAAAIGESMP